MLFSQAGDHFVGELITTKVGIMVHGSSLAEGEGKFLITSVLDQPWEYFDKDYHQENT